MEIMTYIIEDLDEVAKKLYEDMKNKIPHQDAKLVDALKSTKNISQFLSKLYLLIHVFISIQFILINRILKIPQIPLIY